MNLQSLACVVLILVWNQPTGTAQIRTKRDPCHLAHARSDVALKLTLRGQSVYHEDEIIPLELAFTSSAIAFLPTDTGISLVPEAHCLSPEKPDPLQDYYLGLVPGPSGAPGSTGPYQTLSSVPYLVHEELNEWKSPPPGKYRLTVVNASVGVVSNEVSFEIIPATPEWQAQELAQALIVLDADLTKPAQFDSERTKHAVRILRFLGSENSTRELVRRFWIYDQRKVVPLGMAYPSYGYKSYERTQPYWDFKAGLIASPYRAIATRELTAAIADHQHPATRAMLETLALLEIQSDPRYPRFLLPRDEGRDEEFYKRAQAKSKEYNRLLARLSSEVQ